MAFQYGVLIVRVTSFRKEQFVKEVSPVLLSLLEASDNKLWKTIILLLLKALW